MAQFYLGMVLNVGERECMSGLELLRRVRQEQQDCRMVFLTGHADFDYVFEAMRNGVSSYILKTESDQELNAQIDKALDEIRKPGSRPARFRRR